MKEMKATRKLKLATRVDLGYQGITHQRRQRRRRRRTRSARSAKVRAGASSWRSTARRINQVVFNGEFVPGNQWVSPDNPYYQKSLPVPARDVDKAKALIKEAGVTTPIAVDFMVPKGAENKPVAEVIQAMAARSRLRHEDPRHRIRDLAEGGRAGRLPGLLSAGAGGPIRTATSTSS